MLFQLKKLRFAVCFLLVFFKSTATSLALGIDFIEKARFNQNGSGLFSLKVDLNKNSHLIAIIKCLNREYKGITKAIGSKAFGNAKEDFARIPDISEVRVDYNEKMLTIELMFKFRTIQALNKALCAINKGLDPPKITYFSLDDALFVREDMNGIAKKLLFYQSYDNCFIKSLDLVSFFKETTYTTIYTFYNRVQDYSNPLSELTKDKKTIRVTHHVFAPEQVEDSIGNRIHLVKKHS